MRAVLALVGCLFATASEAQSLWDHNGSLMTLRASGANRVFSYVNPRAGLPVQQGAVVFSGRKDGDSYSGTAYVFHSRCGATGYAVSGPVSADQRTVTMYGKAPQKDGNCRTVSYRDDILVFSYQDGVEQGARSADRRGRRILRVGANAVGFHADPCGTGQRQLVVHPASANVADDSLDMIGLANLSSVDVLESSVVKQACAFLEDGKRLIVLGNLLGGDKSQGDEDEIRGLDILVLGHEIGHHACGHTAGRLSGEGWTKELEADRYAGMLLARMFKAGKVRNWNDNPEEFLAVISNGMAAGLFGTGSRTHPPASLRVKAIRDGFYKGSNC